jgi:ubiquinone/menaquinone biosynthesis C-methylase UbiE
VHNYVLIKFVSLTDKMQTEHEWLDEKLWIDVELKSLYPPEKFTKIQCARELISGRNFNGKKVLDDGCGTGWFGKMLQEEGAKVVGIDISETLLKEATKYIPSKKASSYDLPFESQSFDYVISFMVLHILDDPVKVLREIYRVLVPGGKLYFGIVHPNAEKWDEKTRLCHLDVSANQLIEERVWIFNLTDGRHFTKHYIHRPLSYYEQELSKLFTISRRLEPKFPKDLRLNGKYAATEYLFMELTKK